MHLALVCPDMTGHLNPMTTLGRALSRQGHRVTLMGLPSSRAVAEARGLEFLEIGCPEFAAGELEADRALLGRLRGYSAVRLTGQMLRRAAAIVLRDAPEIARAEGIEGFVVDQVSPAGTSVAQSLELPFATVCNALAIHMEAGVPPVMMPWPYRQGSLARWRNRIGNRLLSFAAKPVFEEVNQFRDRHRLTPLVPLMPSHDELVQVAQQPAFLDFPREQLPDHFHYTGPWHEPDRDAELEFPWDKLDGRPILYASLGTLQNRLQGLFENIIAACAEQDVQLVLSLGRQEAELDLPTTSNAIIVPYAPQLPLLQQAVAVVTHGGLNTALETLAQGVPMVVIPMTNDQPGVARRAEALGAAAVVLPRSATVKRLRQAIAQVLQQPSYRESAERCQQQLKQAPNVTDAADLISRALTEQTRLTRTDQLQTKQNHSSAK
ncbi:glycosyltransferase [Roseimaritima ulvae]|uniref:MurG-like transferase n=1 Tax=Roseimaritima ulvae TaxID=980254 RepID=A0A5B9QH24_9BACT|nr:glycosyltransferase [Roseimaritima ulvae]QEG38114.1 MurG-like transferase [Roseimaritima ulvae]